MDLKGNPGEGVDLADLAVLDPARGRQPSAEEWIRARAAVDRIVMSGDAATARARHRAGGRRFALARAVVAVVVVAGVVAVPTVTPSAAEKALGAWTARPAAVPGSQVRPLAEKCAERDRRGTPTAVDVLVAERRGIATLLVVRRGTRADLCMSLDSRAVSGYLTGDSPSRTPPGKGMASLEAMVSSLSGKTRDSGAYGQVGPSVVGIDLVMPDGKVINASVGSGWWVAWWPGPEVGTVDFQVVVRTATGSTTLDKDDLWAHR